MAEAPVVDASPLIHLSRADLLPLLQVLGPRILIPSAVFQEINAKGPDDVTVLALQAHTWLIRLPPVGVPPKVARCQLGPGESAAFAWALSVPGTFVVTDDARARRMARLLNIPRIGTLGIIVRARQNQLIPAARPVLESLMEKGMYISELLVREALAQIGE